MPNLHATLNRVSGGGGSIGRGRDTTARGSYNAVTMPDNDDDDLPQLCHDHSLRSASSTQSRRRRKLRLNNSNSSQSNNNNSNSNLRVTTSTSLATTSGDDDDDDADMDDYAVLLTSASAPASLVGVEVLSQLRKKRSNINSLVCAFMASLTTGGTTYAFGIYSGALKRALHFTQSQLDTISTAFFVAGLFSWIPGLCADRFGTRLSISAGGILGATALMLYWAVARQFIELPRDWLVPALSAFGITIFLSCALVTGSVFKIIVACCGPGTKGSAVGVAKGYVGLGAGAYACLFESIRRPGQSDLDFLPMAAFFFILCATVPACILLPTKRELNGLTLVDEATPLHFRTVFVSLIVLAVLIIGNSLAQLFEESDDSNQSSAKASVKTGGEGIIFTSAQAFGTTHYGMAILLVLVWLGPIIALLYLPRREAMPDQGVDAGDSEDDEENDIEERHGGGVDESYNSDSSGNGNMEVRMRKNGATTVVSRRTSPVPRPGAGEPSNDTEAISLLAQADGRIRSIAPFQRAGVAPVGSKPRPTSASSLPPPAIPPPAPMSLPLSLSQQGQVQSSAARASSVGNGNSHDSDDEGDEQAVDVPTSARASNATQAALQEQQQPNLNMLEMIRTPSAWFLLWTTTMLVGGGTVETNNMGQMVEALGLPARVTPASLAFFSVAQAAARVMTGAISESALNWNTRLCCIDNGVPRPFFLLVASLLGLAAHLILAFAKDQFLFVFGSALAGAAFGMVWPLMVLVVGEVFGTAHVGANYLFFDGLSSAGGTLLLSKIVAQEVYEAHIDPNAVDRYTCYGIECFQATHLAVAGVSFTCVFTSVCMLYASRHVYNKRALHIS